jgi:hypothetical protein
MQTVFILLKGSYINSTLPILFFQENTQLCICMPFLCVSIFRSEEFYFLTYNAGYVVQSQLMFRRNMSLPSSLLKDMKSNMKRAVCFMLFYCMAYCSSLKIKAATSSETSVHYTILCIWDAEAYTNLTVKWITAS